MKTQLSTVRTQPHAHAHVVQNHLVPFDATCTSGEKFDRLDRKIVPCDYIQPTAAIF